MLTCSCFIWKGFSDFTWVTRANFAIQLSDLLFCSNGCSILYSCSLRTLTNFISCPIWILYSIYMGFTIIRQGVFMNSLLRGFTAVSNVLLPDKSYSWQWRLTARLTVSDRRFRQRLLFSFKLSFFNMRLIVVHLLTKLLLAGSINTWILHEI